MPAGSYRIEVGLADGITLTVGDRGADRARDSNLASVDASRAVALTDWFVVDGNGDDVDLGLTAQPVAESGTTAAAESTAPPTTLPLPPVTTVEPPTSSEAEVVEPAAPTGSEQLPIVGSSVEVPDSATTATLAPTEPPATSSPPLGGTAAP